MKLFISIELPKETKDILFNLQKSIDKKYAKIKWVAKKNLHITLKYIGEVSEETKELVFEKLKNISFSPFVVDLKNINFFYKNNNPTIIYVDFSSKKKLIELQQKIDSELLDLFSSDQVFSPHIALGRIKKIKKDGLELSISKLNDFSITFPVNDICLVESKTTKDGSRYKLLKKFNK
jgi:RNA 2',3'-cyclic 3'-phosphodiesterase